MSKPIPVLLIANQFPPLGGSGVQRTLKFVKHLRAFGYEPVVLTRDTKRAKLLDETLMADIPEGVEIIRTPAWDLTEWPGVLSLAGKVIARKILVPDGDRLWARFAQKRALAEIKKRGIELVYSTSSPYSDHLLGLYIKKKMPHVKWVVDFRDEWTNNPYTLDNPYGASRTKKEHHMEAEVLRRADRLIANTPIMRQNFLRIHNMSGENFDWIPNGYDEEDFAALDKTKMQNKKFTVTYTGLLYGRRKPDTFFKAVSGLVTDGKIPREAIDIRLIGNYYVDKMEQTIARYSLTGCVRLMAYMPHKDCLQELLRSDALLLLEGSGRGAEAFFTGKVFEYMNTGRPVMAVLPEGAAASLVRESKIGDTADFDDVPAIRDLFYRYYEAYKNGTLSFAPYMDVVQRFERKELTRELAEVFRKAREE